MTQTDETICYLDSHVHFWKLERGDYHWLKPSNPILYRDYMPSDYYESGTTDVLQGCIAVQAAPTVAETEYLLKLAEKDMRILGVVGWLDPYADSFADEYRLLRSNPRFVGIRLDRSVFHGWTDQAPDHLLEHLRLLEEDQFPVDLLIGPAHMPAVLHCLRKVPRLKAVLNHLGSPSIPDGKIEPWSEYINELAEFPHVYCKWSGMITPAGGMNSTLLAPFIHHTAERFGPERLMFGSDWPIAIQAGTLEDVLQLFEQQLPKHWDDAERTRVRRLNARQFYFGKGCSGA